MDDESRHLVMSTDAFARFAEELDAPAGCVPEMVEMFRLPRIPTTGAVHDDLDWFIGSAPVSSAGGEEKAAQAWLDSMPTETDGPAGRSAGGSSISRSGARGPA